MGESSELVRGEQIVETIMANVARELGLRLSAFEWFLGEGDFDHDRVTLAFVGPDGVRRQLQFSTENLEDAPADQGVQAKLQAQVRAALASLISAPRRIGF